MLVQNHDTWVSRCVKRRRCCWRHFFTTRIIHFSGDRSQNFQPGVLFTHLCTIWLRCGVWANPTIDLPEMDGTGHRPTACYWIIGFTAIRGFRYSLIAACAADLLSGLKGKPRMKWFPSQVQSCLVIAHLTVYQYCWLKNPHIMFWVSSKGSMLEKYLLSCW